MPALPFDPAADPWGAAMLGTAAIAVVSLLLVLIPVLRRVGGWLMGLSLLSFLASAVLGTVERIELAGGVVDAAPSADRAEHDADAPAEADVPDPAAPADPNPAPEGELPDDADAAAPTPGDDPADADPVADPDTLGHDDTAPVGHPDDDLPGDEDPTPSADDETPTGPAVEIDDATARGILRDVKKIVVDEEACKRAEEVAEAWKALSQLSAPPHRKKAAALTRKLEKCRKKVWWVVGYLVHRDRVKAREAFEDKIRTSFGEAGTRVYVSIYGPDHEYMRVGLRGSVDAETAQGLLTADLRTEAESLGFAQILVSTGEGSWPFELQPEPEDDYIAAELAPHGLASSLELPPAPDAE